MPFIDLLNSYGATAVDFYIVLAGFGVVGWVAMSKAATAKEITDMKEAHAKEIDDIKSFHRANIKELKQRLGVLSGKYLILNTWIFHVDQGLEIDALEPGNSEGDVHLKWRYGPRRNKKQS